jgi:hypothetical protein
MTRASFKQPEEINAMRAIGLRRSAVAMMMVAGGLAAAVNSYAQPAAAPKDKGSPTAIPCNLTPKEQRARKKATIPCDSRKSAKKDAAMGPLGYKKKRGGADKLGDIK